MHCIEALVLWLVVKFDFIIGFVCEEAHQLVGIDAIALRDKVVLASLLIGSLIDFDAVRCIDGINIHVLIANHVANRKLGVLQMVVY